MLQGKVIRPAYGKGDGELTLTATLTVGGVTKKIEYKASVKETGMTDTQIVAADKLALAFPVDHTKITADVVLPSLGANGSKITWSTNKDSIMTADGKVTRPVNGAINTAGKVTMTAIISKGDVSETKDFECIVLPWTDEEEAQHDADSLVWETIKGKNISKLDVMLNLELPTEGERGSIITWVSNNETIVSNAGVVTRPSYIQGDILIALSATVTKNSVSKKVNITGIRVLKQSMTNKEAAEKAINGIDVGSIKGQNVGLDQVVSDMILPKKSLLEDCGSVQFTWTVIATGADTPDPTNANAKIIDQGDKFLCRITRPLSSEKNAEPRLKCVSDSTGLSGGDASSYKIFPIVIVKQDAVPVSLYEEYNEVATPMAFSLDDKEVVSEPKNINSKMVEQKTVRASEVRNKKK